MGAGIILHFKFLFDEASNFREYTESIFISSNTLITAWCYASMVYKREELFELVDVSEELLVLFRESEY